MRLVSTLTKKQRHVLAVRRWEQNNPLRVKEYKHEAMLRKAERTQQLPRLKTLLNYDLSADQILRLVRAHSPESAGRVFQ